MENARVLVCAKCNRAVTNLFSLIFISVLGVLTTGCASNSAESVLPLQGGEDIIPFTGDPQQKKSIFVFLDGTQNDAKSETNVWKLFKAIETNGDPQTTGLYLKGVGTAEGAAPTEALLGQGMEPKVLSAYQFLSQNYRVGDHLYLFGFSRGAHQARFLSGLVSYAGIPANFQQSRPISVKTINGIIELVKKIHDDDYRAQWDNWKPGQDPFLKEKLEDDFGIKVQAAEIKFLGLWDTVPGSSLKTYESCKEHRGFVKKHLSWLVPGIDSGERYKTDSYPSIRRIAHAVALDEKRSKFAPLLVCEPINPEYTTLSEVWFPGAHADVGGGYPDSSELPSISFNWMVGFLKELYPLKTYSNAPENVAGLMHWSISIGPANIGSDCEDRVPNKDAHFHCSIAARKNMPPAPVKMSASDKSVKMLAYPLTCKLQAVAFPVECDPVN